MFKPKYTGEDTQGRHFIYFIRISHLWLLASTNVPKDLIWHYYRQDHLSMMVIVTLSGLLGPFLWRRSLTWLCRLTWALYQYWLDNEYINHVNMTSIYVLWAQLSTSQSDKCFSDLHFVTLIIKWFNFCKKKCDKLWSSFFSFVKENFIPTFNNHNSFYFLQYIHIQ